MMAKSDVRQPRALKFKHPSYQPSKAELKEDVSIDASPEEIARAALRPVHVVYEEPKRKGWLGRREAQATLFVSGLRLHRH